MSHAIPKFAQRRIAIDDLDRAILKAAAKLNKVTYQLLQHVREFDERAGFLRWGFRNCADWLAWRCDISSNAAREKVRVAHVLKQLPEISQAFSRGELSYTKARALTRVATPTSESDLLAYALRVTANRVEERCRQIRNVQPSSTADANFAHRTRSVTVIRNEERGSMTITIEAPIEQGEVIVRALDKATENEPDDAMTEDSPWRARQVDGAVAVAKHYLSGGSGRHARTGDAYQVIVHVDESALKEGSGRSDLPIESVRRLTCDTGAVTMIDDADGAPLSIGRKKRTVPPAIRRALISRDAGCAFPGCRHTKFLDAHHIEHWAQGGDTSVQNLVLLCSYHHRLVHEGGFEIATDRRGRKYFRRPDGRAVPVHGYVRSDYEDDAVGTSEVPDFQGNASTKPPAGVAM